MNKKFFTLLAASCAAMAVNAQTIYYNGTDGKVKTAIDEKYSSMQLGAQDDRFPYTVFGAAEAPTTPINQLTKVNKGAEAKLFQLMVTTTGNAKGHLLAMQWNDKVNKYQLVLINPEEQDASYFVEETLWQVSATMVGESKALRYTLINKGAQLPLQLATTADKQNPSFVTGSSITWTWSEVADAGKDADDKLLPLSGVLTAAVDAQKSIYLTAAKKADNSLAGGAIETVKVERGSTAPEGALTFAAYEAAPISLTAAQINAMMTGTEHGTTIQFNMDPQVAPDGVANPLTDSKFQAYQIVKDEPANDVLKTYQKTLKDAGLQIELADAENYVVLAKDNKIANLLRVDTVYHNDDLDARYELKLTTSEIEAPRETYVIGKKLLDEKAAGNSDVPLKIKDGKEIANVVIAEMQKQALFRFQYKPSEGAVLIQAKQYVYRPKDAKFSWWNALYNNSDAAASGNANYIIGFSAIETALGENVFKAPTISATPVEIKESEATKAAGLDADQNQYGLSVANPTGNPAVWTNNMIKLTTLTTSPEHTELTVGYDKRDVVYDGIKTLITIGTPMIWEEAADIKAGFYYVQNGNEVSTDLLKSGYWRYFDLAATNKTSTVYDDRSGKWVIDMNTIGYENPNMVYSAEKLTNIPSAQWYFNGTAGAGFYTIANRESLGEMASSVYLWKVKKNGVVVPNTYACKGQVDPTVNDTIVIAPATINPLDGYMNISKEVANADTTVFNFKFSVLGGEALTVGETNGILTVLNGEGIDFKVERVRIEDEDEYTGEKVAYTDDLIYGMPTTKADTLRRALYRIYKEDVSANSSENTGKRTREYVTLDGGQYKLEAYVVTVDAEGYTSYSKDDNSGKEDNRKAFYIKNVTNTANEFVLVDPTTTNTADSKIGVRAFVNQVSGILQPAGLKSQGASNVYDNSLFTFEKITKYNYRDIRREGADRDTLVFHKDGNKEIKLYETSVKGAYATLLARDNNAQYDKNFALFVDTANVQNADMPIFLLGLRPSDYAETGSSIDHHNRHISTTADYLMVLTDSAAVNPAYKDIKGNIRLGFVNATHFADSRLVLTNSDKTFDLTKKALTPATFAFRYVDKARDAFYIETADVDGAPAWVKVINEVPVIVKDIKEAEIYNVETTTDAPTANDAINASEVSVEAVQGAVIVKNAAGKTVAISNILGKTLANEVLTSDNATIAVPAGIVVVAVDGEEAVKAIVK